MAISPVAVIAGSVSSAVQQTNRQTDVASPSTTIPTITTPSTTSPIARRAPAFQTTQEGPGKWLILLWIEPMLTLITTKHYQTH